jgi:hypothetical protein
MSNIKMAEVYFHIKESQPSVGESNWDCSSSSAINIVATGTATAFEIDFEGKVGDVWSKTTGVRLDNLAILNKMDTKEVAYQVDLTAFKNFRANLVSVTGGDITIYGYAVK